ncbi:hypothetical protein ACFQHO_16805 [Actinomadura yumaensis]
MKERFSTAVSAGRNGWWPSSSACPYSAWTAGSTGPPSPSAVTRLVSGLR